MTEADYSSLPDSATQSSVSSSRPSSQKCSPSSGEIEKDSNLLSVSTLRHRRNSAPSRLALLGAKISQKAHQIDEWYHTLHVSEVSAYLIDNPYIIRGYRKTLSWGNCVRSLFTLHNETLNIWTHFGGFLIFLALLIYTLITLSPYGFDRQRAFGQFNIRVRDQIQNYMPDLEYIAHSAAVLRDNAIKVEEQLEANVYKATEEVAYLVETLKQQLGRVCATCPTPKDLADTLFSLVRSVGSLVPEKGTAMVQNLLSFASDIQSNMSFRYPPIDTHDFLPRWPLAVFMLSAMACLLFSSVFHLFLANSEETCRRFQKLDHAGICCLIAGSFIPIQYYGFYCQQHFQIMYNVVLAIGTACELYLVLSARFYGDEYRVLKALVFSIVGLWGLVPACHMIIMNGVTNTVYYLISMGAIYLGGAMLYVIQFPESSFPGKFDIFGSSHQLWHVAVIIAALVHYFGLNDLYEWRMVNLCTDDVVRTAVV
eukprot:236906_1